MSYHSLDKKSQQTSLSGYPRNYDARRRAKEPRWLRWRVLVVAAITLLWFIVHYRSRIAFGDVLQSRLVNTPPVFSWDKITPSQRLEYHPCYQDFQCARLEVPMDWQRNDTKGKTVALAIVRLPAKVPVTDARYAGPVLTNPGGPGGSGVEQILRAGKMTQYIVDADMTPNTTSSTDRDNDTRRYHDIISWDPRSIGFSTPNVQCFPDSLSRETWLMQNEAIGLLGSSEDSWLRNWYRAKALASGCSVANGETLDGSEAFAQHVNTVAVVRDMLEIIDRHADWVEQERERLLFVQDKRPNGVVHVKNASQDIVKLKYWGNSYGTLIGQTFSSLYPDRVGRLVLDGVVDAEQYYFGPWFANLQDSDKILSRFFEHCFDAGPDRCSYYNAAGADAIRQEYESLLTHIFDHPIGVPCTSSRGPDVITWSDVKSTVRLGMYMPIAFFPIIAELLADVGRGNGSLMADFKQSMGGSGLSCPSPTCKAAGPYTPACNAAGTTDYDASLAILCSDIDATFADVNETGFQMYWHKLQGQSKVLGDWWAHTRLGCVGWKVKPKWQFEGPVGGRTEEGILFVNPSLDPVTPLEK